MAEMKACQDCGEEFEINPTARYPRKYCDSCSAERKKEYENIDQIEFEDCED